jgi:hypothetical protein
MTIININGIATVCIEPFKAYWRDNGDSTHFGIVLNHDDFVTTARITWYLMRFTNEGGWVTTDSDTVTVDIQNYTDWDGSSEYIFTHLTKAIGITIID